MAEEWRIAKRSRTCAHSGAAIETGRPFYSALIETGDLFERRDFSIDAWPEVDKTAFFSHWKNKGGEPEKRPPVDFDRLLSFFDRLEGEEGREKRLLRYVLALVLARRRRLRLDDMSKTADGDRLVARDRRTGREIIILSPNATSEELAEAEERLGRLFEGDFDENADPGVNPG